MAGAEWKFLLANAKDLSPIGELTQARGRQLSLALNQSGSASFTIPMDDDLGQLIYPITYAIMAYRSGSTGVQLVWSGFVNTIEEDALNNRMTVNCLGWLDRLSSRLIHQPSGVTYAAGTDDGAIIQNLLLRANGGTDTYASGTTSVVLADGITISWPSGSSPNSPTWISWGGTLPNEGSGGATAYVTHSRSASYPQYQTKILQAIQGLLEIENGADISIDHQTRQLYVYRKRRRILAGVVFGYNWGPHNIAQFGRQIDGSTIVNLHIAFGASGTTPAYSADAPSQNMYGPLEDVTSLSDVNVNATLQAYANGETIIRAQPRQLYNFIPFNWTLGSSVPEPLVDYRIGDQVSLRAVQLPRLNIDQQVRIFGIQFNIDDDGNEKIGQLQVYPG